MRIGLRKIIAIVLILVSLPLIMIGLPKLFNDSKEEKITLSEEQVDELYSYIPSIDNELYNIFQNKKVTVNDVNNQLLYNKIYSNMEESDMRGSVIYEITKDNCSQEGGIYINNSCYVYDLYKSSHYFFDKDVLSNRFVKYYGSHKTSELPYNVKDKDKDSCDLIDDRYFCSTNRFTMKDGYNESIIKFNKYEAKSNEIYIYVDYLYAELAGDDPSGNIIVKVYKSKGDKELGSTYTFSSEIIFDKYADKARMYKNTYKKDKTGNFYWYSIEPVKE
jgi:hypothetical protein